MMDSDTSPATTAEGIARQISRQLQRGNDADKASMARAANAFILRTDKEIEGLANARYSVYLALGGWLFSITRRLPGRPKLSHGDNLPTYEAMGIDRRVASKAMQMSKVPERIRDEYERTMSERTPHGLFEFVRLFKEREAAGADGGDPLPIDAEDKATLDRARTPRGKTIGRLDAAKATVATLFHAGTEPNERGAAVDALLRLVPDVQDRITRALTSNGAILPPGEDIDEAAELADGRKYWSTASLKRIIAEKDALLIAQRAEIDRLKKENARLRSRRNPKKKRSKPTKPVGTIAALAPGARVPANGGHR